jgi:hypothetical protein
MINLTPERDFMLKVRAENGFIYEDYHPKCKIRFSSLRYGHGEFDFSWVAFVQCFDEETGDINRYWGMFDDDNKERSVEMILLKGSKWPDLPVEES